MHDETKNWIWNALGYLLLAIFILFNIYMLMRLPASLKNEIIQEMNNLQQYD
jgi:flagellar biogenesis protein FliO